MDVLRTDPHVTAILIAHDSVRDGQSRQLARDGKLPATKFGNTWRFLRSDIRNTIAGGGQLGSLEKVLGRRGVKVTTTRK